MEEVRGLVARNWPRWEQGIGAVQVQEDDFVLYLMWGLDLVKEQGEGVNERFREMVFSALRRKFIKSSFSSNGQDLNYLSDLVCAGVMYCYGLVLTESLGYLHVYDELLKGLGESWRRIQDIKGGIVADGSLIKNWMIEYMKSEKFYTEKDELEWAAGDGSEVLIRRVQKKKSCAKVDLYRVILALYRLGFFESANGEDLDQETVFEAFGRMLGEDFSGYSNNLSRGSDTPEVDIFRRLEEAFYEYEEGKLEKKKVRR